ncbi:MAG: lysophospholipid acyltransferase family protein, partial [Planctomycetota bacterium]
MALKVPLRLLLLTGVTVPLYAGWVLTRPVAWVLPKTDKGLQRFWVGRWARSVLRILGVDARYEGPAPDGPFFLVCNHLSYVDIPVLLARLDARFLAKSEIASWPVLGLLARSTGTLFIDRSRKRDLTRVMPAIERVLGRGPGVIIFPEGTSTDGSAVQPFKPSLFEVPVEMDLKVVCAALHYDCPEGPRPAWEAVCWWG